MLEYQNYEQAFYTRALRQDLVVIGVVAVVLRVRGTGATGLQVSE